MVTLETISTNQYTLIMTNSVQQSPHVNNLIEKKRKTEGSGSALDGIQPLDNQKKAKIKPRVQVPAELRKPGEDENTMIPQDDLRQRELAAYEPRPFAPTERGLPSENANTLISQETLRKRKLVPVPAELRQPGEDENTMIPQDDLRQRELAAYEPLPFVPAERGLPSENENTLIYLNALRHMISQNALRLRELEASQRQLEAYQRGLRSL